MDEPSDLSAVLAAFAATRSRFSDLLAQLPSEAKSALDVRIHQASSEGASSYTVAALSATRSDGREVVWSVSLLAGKALEVARDVELETENGYESLFYRSEVSPDAAHAARLIREMAHEVATQLGAFDGLFEQPSAQRPQ